MTERLEQVRSLIDKIRAVDVHEPVAPAPVEADTRMQEASKPDVVPRRENVLHHKLLKRFGSRGNKAERGQRKSDEGQETVEDAYEQRVAELHTLLGELSQHNLSAPDSARVELANSMRNILMSGDRSAVEQLYIVLAESND